MTSDANGPKAITLPEELYKKIEARIKGTEFASVSDYATYALEQIFSEDEHQEQPYTKEEEEKVK